MKVSIKSPEIVVTGATGFVGKVLIKKLVKKFGSEKILCLVYDKESVFEKSGRTLLNKLGVSYKLIDLTNKKSIPKFSINPKLIIHLAAETDTSKRNHEVNDNGTRNLLDSFDKLNSKTHFIHIGTMVEVVGRQNCDSPIDEFSDDYPTNAYTRTKLIGEKLVIDRCKKNKFRLTVIRPNTIYGKYVRKNSLFDMVIKMVKSESIITKINWPGKSALIHVEDLTDLIMKFTDTLPKTGIPEKYLAYSENLTIFEISRIVHKNLKIPFKPILIPRLFWELIKKVRPLIPIFEYLLPYYFYNVLWRFGIIIDDVVWCNTNKLYNKIEGFKPIKFDSGVKDVLKL